jgi:hypothetical protein
MLPGSTWMALLENGGATPFWSARQRWLDPRSVLFRKQ